MTTRASKESLPAEPLVSVCLATRNGADGLSFALDSLVGQTHRNLEIVVSDNASEDETQDIALRFKDRDPRVRYVRLDSPVTMWNNFANAYREAHGEFCLFAADDDVYGEDFIERLLDALQADPSAQLAFGEVRHFAEYGRHEETGVVFPYSGATNRKPVWRRLIMERNAGYAVQGLFRVSALRNYRWWDHSTSPDWPLMTYMLVVGEIIDVPDAVIYRPNWQKKSGEERAERQSYTKMERFPSLTLSLSSARAAKAAAALVGKRRFVAVDFVLILFQLLREHRRRLVSLSEWRARLRRWVFG